MRIEADNDGGLNGDLSLLKEGDGCVVLMGNSKRGPSARHPYPLPRGEHGTATHRVVRAFSRMSDNLRTGPHNLVEVEEV